MGSFWWGSKPTKDLYALDALEIVEEMKQACETAICTLNDVLLYDKIEGGTMMLEKRQIPVIQLLCQTIRPFYIQARSNDVELSLFRQNFDTLEGCLLEVDVNKVSQVIRNFLSNALKFTPSHGSITLKAYRTEVGGAGIIDSYLVVDPDF